MMNAWTPHQILIEVYRKNGDAEALVTTDEKADPATMEIAADALLKQALAFARACECRNCDERGRRLFAAIETLGLASRRGSREIGHA